MGAPSRPRKGSLQYYPRCRTAKALPSANWKMVHGKGVLGYIGYKVGMATAIVKDNTADSMIKGLNKAIPVTILELPNMKIFSVRFYNKGCVAKDVIVSNDKELKRVVKVPEKLGVLEAPKEYDDVRAVVFSLPHQIDLKKTPDIIEVALGADTKEAKFELAKSFVGKEISIHDFAKTELVDVRGVTKGKGFTGPTKRFGLSLRAHKSEKGRRGPGSIAPWHPARVTFRTPRAGQMGMFARVGLNQKVVSIGKIADKNINPSSGFQHYGNIKTNYILIKGSVQGPPMRQILITPAYRPTKLKQKQKFDLINLETH
jgi:large subunit ribosomal protein L3